jgi:hypothetical protein
MLRISMAFPGYLLFFVMLFVPNTYQSFKATLGMLVLEIIAINALIHGRLVLHRTVLLWILFMVTIGSAFIFRGFLNDAPGALRVSTIYVLWPLIFSILVAGVANEKRLRGLLVVLVLASIAISLYAFSYILYTAGWLPEYLYIPLEQGQNIGFYTGYIEFILHSISSLLFLVPFTIAALMTWPKEQPMPVSRLWLWIAFILGVIIVLFSARRALIGIVALSPLFTLCIQQFLPTSMRWIRTTLGIRSLVYAGIFFAGILIFLHIIYGFDLRALLDTFAVGWDFTGEQSAMDRRDQFFPLLQGWSANPLLGSGHGASAPGSVRSSEMPWSYELSYLALLFHTGVLGFLAYASGIAWIFWMGLKIIRQGNHFSLYMLPLLVGFSCFLMGNASNPYLEKFDYMWVVFLPIAFVNYWLLDKRRQARAT